MIATHGVFDFLHHLLCALLGVGTEVSLHVGLPQRFAEIVVHIANAALPSRLEFLGSLQGLAIEIKVGIHEIG